MYGDIDVKFRRLGRLMDKSCDVARMCRDKIPRMKLLTE